LYFFALSSAIDFDLSENRIYWTDVKLKTITRVFINGSDIEKIVDLGLESPEGIAFDWIAHNLYWSDTITRRIEMIRIEGGSRKILLWQNLLEPKNVAVDPERGCVFYSILAIIFKLPLNSSIAWFLFIFLFIYFRFVLH